MTCVIYDHKERKVAIDSRITSGGLIVSDYAIKYIKNEAGLWFMAGPTSEYENLIKLSHDDKVDNGNESVALLVKEDGAVYVVGVDGEYCYHCPMNNSWAIGSGSCFALAALDHGKSVLEAVEYAMTRDVYTSGKVQVYDIGKGKFI